MSAGHAGTIAGTLPSGARKVCGAIVGARVIVDARVGTIAMVVALGAGAAVGVAHATEIEMSASDARQFLIINTQKQFGFSITTDEIGL